MDSLSLSHHRRFRSKITIVIVPVVAALPLVAGLKCSFCMIETQKHIKELMHDNSMDKLPITYTSSSSISHRSYLARRNLEKLLSINVALCKGTGLCKISYKELKEATKGFCEGARIGSEGFSSIVYKATLDDQTVVAVKKLIHKIDEKGEPRDFQAEIKTIGKIKHPNLVSLWGYSQTDNERLLIYEYMENGSLYK
ncbi:hypothetical protein L7F22_060139 [Adiantum nelumboides]|nr:hypothetical protein [Adiantum nelumboides]MCO5550128.1 hypothetical protein [Adiantum nelumboides]MCO5558325.1 hypothetical protein [Adiantum nelumboides]MCO5558331.1 hypothetical protein [Adiantum nelumboides]MCO5558333.1 hypothetical protein [Adiantum nelumboides]